MPRTIPVRVECQQCGRSFDCLDYRRNRPPKYCSRKCRDIAQTTRVMLACRQCGQSFERKAYMEEWSQDRGPFCSFDCYGRWQSENTTGGANPNFVPRSNARLAGQWYRVRLDVLERDDNRCVRCGRTDRLHVHHKVHFRPGQDDPHAADNLETLCASCHRREHPVPHGPDGRFVSIP
jgi:ribosomal protein S27AE